MVRKLAIRVVNQDVRTMAESYRRPQRSADARSGSGKAAAPEQEAHQQASGIRGSGGPATFIGSVSPRAGGILLHLAALRRDSELLALQRLAGNRATTLALQRERKKPEIVAPPGKETAARDPDDAEWLDRARTRAAQLTILFVDRVAAPDVFRREAKRHIGGIDDVCADAVERVREYFDAEDNQLVQAFKKSFAGEAFKDLAFAALGEIPHLKLHAILGNLIVDGMATHAENVRVAKVTKRSEELDSLAGAAQGDLAKTLLSSSHLPVIKVAEGIGKLTGIGESTEMIIDNVNDEASQFEELASPRESDRDDLRRSYLMAAEHFATYMAARDELQKAMDDLATAPEQLAQLASEAELEIRDAYVAFRAGRGEWQLNLKAIKPMGADGYRVSLGSIGDPRIGRASSDISDIVMEHIRTMGLGVYRRLGTPVTANVTVGREFKWINTRWTGYSATGGKVHKQVMENSFITVEPQGRLVVQLDVGGAVKTRHEAGFTPTGGKGELLDSDAEKVVAALEAGNFADSQPSYGPATSGPAPRGAVPDADRN